MRRSNPQINMFKRSPQSTFEQEGKLPSFKSDTEKDSNNKRSRAPPEYDDEEDDEEPEVSADELAKMSRSERKRHREKKRRNDVNKGLDELMNLLFEIDPNLRKETEEYRSRRGKIKGGTAGAHDENILSRVDLIAHAVEILRRVHRENEERKKIIAALTLSAQSRAPVTTAATANIANMQPGSLTNSLLQHLNRNNQFPSLNNCGFGVGESAISTLSQLDQGDPLVEQLSKSRLISQLLTMSGPPSLLNNSLVSGSFRQLPGQFLNPSGVSSLLHGHNETVGNISNLVTTPTLADQYLQLLQNNQSLTDFMKRSGDFECNDNK